MKVFIERLFIIFLSVMLFILPVVAYSEAAASDAIHSYIQNNKTYQYLYFGNYPQVIDDPGLSQQKNAWKWSRNPTASHIPEMHLDDSPILWRVLDVDENNVAYMYSEYVLFAMPLHKNITEYKSIGDSFIKTDLGKYLNTVFISEAFPSHAIGSLMPVADSVTVGIPHREDLTNKNYGFASKKSRFAWGTEYAIRRRCLFVYRVAVGQHSPYWMMEQASKDLRHGRSTKQDGSLGHIVCDRENIGVRPTVRLDLTNISISSGSGSIDDPFVLDLSELKPSLGGAEGSDSN